MKTKRNLSAVAIAIAACASLLWLSTIRGSEKTYEVHPYITTPEYRTDAARAIDAYERLMQRYMDLTERNLFGLKRDLKSLAARLDSIDVKLTQISTRMAGIEKTLGIIPPKEPAETKSLPRHKKKKNRRKSSPGM